MRTKDFEKARELAEKREHAKKRLADLAGGVRVIRITDSIDYSGDIKDEATCAIVATILTDDCREEIERLTDELAKLGVVP